MKTKYYEDTYFFFIIITTTFIFPGCSANKNNQISEPITNQNIEMILVEAGEFKMGNRNGFYDSEKPEHYVILEYDFYIGKYEVTFEEYDLYCKMTNSEKPNDIKWGRGKKPVIYVSWIDAIDYCNWLSEKENLPFAYDNNGDLLDKDGKKTDDITNVAGYRLPTEAEWEFAALSGNMSENCIFSGDNDLHNVGWYMGNSGYKTKIVGKKNSNKLGIYDMSGNVWEWCNDWFGKYSQEKQINPVGPESGTTKVIRGGSWGDSGYDCRIKRREENIKTDKYSLIGFRICLTSIKTH